MLYRFSMARTVAEEVAARSIISLYRRIDTSGFKDSDYTITLFNTLNFSRRAVVPVVIDIPKLGADGIVDPCTGIGENTVDVKHFDIVDRRGQQGGLRRCCPRSRTRSPSSGSWTPRPSSSSRSAGGCCSTWKCPKWATRRWPSARAGRITCRTRRPGRTGRSSPRERRAGERAPARPHPPNGTFDLTHKAAGRTMAGLHYFTDGGQVGSAHRNILPQRSPVFTSLGASARITMEETGKLRGVYRIDLTLLVPSAATGDGRDRTRDLVEVPITTWLTLEKGGRFLKLRTRLTNAARDHKLRVMFPSGVAADQAAVESAFAVDTRNVRWTQSGGQPGGLFPVPADAELRGRQRRGRSAWPCSTRAFASTRWWTTRTAPSRSPSCGRTGPT